MTNADFLDWFPEAERNLCSSCGKKACVGLPDVPAHFCLNCGAITIGGMRIDVRGAVQTEL